MTAIHELIDMDEIFEIMDNDTELIKECFDDFIQEYPRMLENIQQAIASGDAAGLDIHAHKIKGSLRYLAASGTAGIASALEQKGKKGEIEGAEDLYRQLRESCDQLKTVMSRYEA